jgi:hypothetical protein
VRRGEVIRLSLGPRRPESGYVCVDKLCTTSLWPSGPDLRFFGGQLGWRVRLSPGRYAATVVLLSGQPGTGITQETGIVGLLVSKTQPEQIVSTPDCRR